MLFSMQTPFWVIFVAIVAVVSCLLSLKKSKRSLLDISLTAAGLAGFIWILFEMLFFGAGPLFAIALGPAYLMYIPLSIVFGAASRLVFRRKLHFFQGAENEG